MPLVVQVQMGHISDGQHEMTTLYTGLQGPEWQDGVLRRYQMRMPAGHYRHATMGSS